MVQKRDTRRTGGKGAEEVCTCESVDQASGTRLERKAKGLRGSDEARFARWEHDSSM